jgi:UDP-N-acetylglucosamine 4,6-dehydratase
MGSRGSVIPLFIDQLKRGAAVTVTDPNMTRFLMSLEESVDLVLYAYTHCQQGDILVQKAPASTIGDLAEAMKRIFGRSAPTAIIGTRHGEKLYETLISREEMARAVDLGGFYRVPYDDRDLNYSTFFTEGEIEVSATDDYTSHNTVRLGVDELVEMLGRLDFVKRELAATERV